jgi:toxin ParE1/3/4
MRELRFSRRADSDLVGIAAYTTREFGTAQARAYRDRLAACFASLQRNPYLGRSADDLAPGLRRIRQGAHIIFYLPDDSAILIVRVLHHSMDFERHFQDVNPS